MKTSTPKSPGVAMALGILIPGGGYFYLRHLKEGFIVLGAALAFGVMCALVDLPDAVVRGGGIGLAMASAMGARALAIKLNAELAAAPAPSPSPRKPKKKPRPAT